MGFVQGDFTSGQLQIFGCCQSILDLSRICFTCTGDCISNQLKRIIAESRHTVRYCAAVSRFVSINKRGYFCCRIFR
ncbi:hypothetical protein D3C86_2009560 [compost metagenome]